MRRVLLLHYTPHPEAVRLTTAQHLDALAAARRTDVVSYNAVNGAPRWLRHLRFDAVVLHTTVLTMRWNVWFDQWKHRLDWLADVDALKVALPQDEYDHADVLDEWLDELGVSVVCTVLDGTHRHLLYPRLHRSAAFYDVLTGYVDRLPAKRARAPARGDRPFDVVYRARHLPYWYGSHGQLKHRIGDAVLARAARNNLRVDISTSATETILGGAWLDFLAGGRATVGVESGVSTLDRRGELRARIGDLLLDEPFLTFEQVAARMPRGWDDYRFFAVSPRHLEAVATRTAQVLVEGRYSGVLEPERHYIPVRRDLGDLEEALERLGDAAAVGRMTEAAYRDVVESGRYDPSTLTRALERILDRHAPARSRPPGRAYRAARRAAALEEEAQRIVVAPVANVARVGGTGVSEMAAGLRHVATDAPVRQLLLAYLGASEMREHVSPREALRDLLCLATLRRAAAGGAGTDFAVRAELDEERRRLVVRSVPAASNVPEPVPAAALERLLRTGALEFAWDHSSVGRSISFAVAGSRSLTLELPAGPQTLPVLSWLARRRPARVLAALTPLLGPRT